MQKQAVGPLLGLAGRAVGFTAGKVLPKTLNAGYKGLIRPMARMVFKRPGLAITGAMLPSWIGGNINTARGKGLSSLPRSLPKFASIQGEEMSDKKYPSIFYKIEGFEKMAAEAEAAHRLVRDWDRGLAKKAGTVTDIIKSITGFGQKSTLSVVKEQLAKRLGEVLSSPGLDAPFAGDIPKIVGNYKNTIAQTAKELKPKSIKELLRGGSPLIGALAIGIPAYYYGHKAYKNYKENEAVEDSYDNMLKIYPELQKENPQNTRQYFDYIKQYSPTVAKNPHAAGAIVRRFASTGGMAMDNSVIKNLLEVEKVKSDSKPRHEGVLGTIGAMI